jgi:hypothetical protein
MGQDVKMSADAAARIKDRFNNLSQEFANTRHSVSAHAADITTACGEFSGSVEDGKESWVLSWRETFDVCRTAAAVIAGNTNTFEVELTRLDQDYGHVPTL